MDFDGDIDFEDVDLEDDLLDAYEKQHNSFDSDEISDD